MQPSGVSSARVAEENLRVLDEAFEQFNRSGRPPAASMHADIEWLPVREDPDFQVHIGVDAVIGYLDRWSEAFDDLHAERLAMIPSGEKVLVWFRLTGKGRESGVPVELEQGIVYSFRDGRIARGEEFTDRADAERAAGIG